MDAHQNGLAIEVEGLAKRFGKVQAVDELEFRIPRGVIAGFVGPNGSGKTTTMRIIATLLRQEAGTARVFGQDTRSPAQARQVRHSIGFMPDYFGLYPDMTAAEYLAFFAAAYRIPSSRCPSLVADILALIGLTEKSDTLIAGLSRGMQQKLSLGRSLVHSPELLLLDEPASGLDPRARIELMELLRELRSMGKTIFISSHILSELHHLCDMVVIVEKGHAVYVGGLEEASEGVLHGQRLLELEIEGDPEAALVRLNQTPGISAIRRKERRLFLQHDGSLGVADLLAQCVRDGIRVSEARRVSANLEEIFMHLTGAPDEEGRTPL
jgi:ABC-2 type transport system ATP-binding protein